MIELPEAVVLARQITQTLPGKTIVHAVANASPHKFAWYSGDPANYQHLLAGRMIEGALAHGNHVEIHADDMLLVLNTPIRFHPRGEKPPRKHQLYLEFEDCASLSCTVQMWGGLFCFPKGEQGGMPDYHVAMQAPSPLSKKFSSAYFRRLLGQCSGTISAKEFLATEQRVPGLGNGALQDILWTSHIHPRQKIGTLSESDILVLFSAVKDVLAAMVAGGGRDTERDLFGQPGRYKTILSKNTTGTPCPACGTQIRKEAFLGGSIYYCSACQKL